MTTDGTPPEPDAVPPYGRPEPPPLPQPPGPQAYGSPAGYGVPPGLGAAPAYGAPPGYAPAVAPDNHLVWAILSTVLCCLPLGIVSIVYAAQVNDKWLRGDVTGALESSRKAKQFATWSAIVHVGLFAVVAVVYLAFFAVVLGTGVSTAP